PGTRCYSSGAFSPDGKLYAYLTLELDLVLWDVEARRIVRTVPARHAGNPIIFSPDGRALAAAFGYGSLKLWDVATGAPLPHTADERASVSNLRFADGGRRLLGTAETVVAWDPTTGRELHRFPNVRRTGGFHG